MLRESAILAKTRFGELSFEGTSLCWKFWGGLSHQLSHVAKTHQSVGSEGRVFDSPRIIRIFSKSSYLSQSFATKSHSPGYSVATYTTIIASESELIA
jgi:hypothetical protein